jgi:hypothetical protein
MVIPTFKSFVDQSREYDDDISPIPIYNSPINHERPELEIEEEEI